MQQFDAGKIQTLWISYRYNFRLGYFEVKVLSDLHCARTGYAPYGRGFESCAPFCLNNT